MKCAKMSAKLLPEQLNSLLCRKPQDSSILSWGWVSSCNEGHRDDMGLIVPGLHYDLPHLTESIWSPRAAESWAWNLPPCPLKSIPTFCHTLKKQRRITCSFTETHTSSYRSRCPASPPCALPVLNAPVEPLQGFLCLLSTHLLRTKEYLTFLSEGASKLAL